MRAQQLNARQKGLLLMHDQEAPLLPELDEFLVKPPPFEEVPFDDATKKKPKKSADDVEMKDPGSSATDTPEKLNQLEPIDTTPPQTLIPTEEVASRPVVF